MKRNKIVIKILVIYSLVMLSGCSNGPKNLKTDLSDYCSSEGCKVDNIYLQEERENKVYFGLAELRFGKQVKWQVVNFINDRRKGTNYNSYSSYLTIKDTIYISSCGDESAGSSAIKEDYNIKHNYYYGVKVGNYKDVRYKGKSLKIQNIKVSKKDQNIYFTSWFLESNEEYEVVYFEQELEYIE